MSPCECGFIARSPYDVRRLWSASATCPPVAAEHGCRKRHRGRRSGKWWSAGLESRCSRLSDSDDGFDPAINGDARKFDVQHWRRSERARHGGGCRANRTEIVGMIAGMALRLAVVRLGDRLGRCDQRDQASLRALSCNRMNVTKGQAEIDDQRQQRKPCPLPYIVPEPAHICVEPQLSQTFSWLRS